MRIDDMQTKTESVLFIEDAKVELANGQGPSYKKGEVHTLRPDQAQRWYVRGKAIPASAKPAKADDAAKKAAETAEKKAADDAAKKPADDAAKKVADDDASKKDADEAAKKAADDAAAEKSKTSKK